MPWTGTSFRLRRLIHEHTPTYARALTHARKKNTFACPLACMRISSCPVHAQVVLCMSIRTCPFWPTPECLLLRMVCQKRPRNRTLQKQKRPTEWDNMRHKKVAMVRQQFQVLQAALEDEKSKSRFASSSLSLSLSLLAPPFPFSTLHATSSLVSLNSSSSSPSLVRVRMRVCMCISLFPSLSLSLSCVCVCVFVYVYLFYVRISLHV